MRARIVLVVLAGSLAALVALGAAWIGSLDSDRSPGRVAGPATVVVESSAGADSRTVASGVSRLLEPDTAPRRSTTLRDLVAPARPSSMTESGEGEASALPDWELLRPHGEGPHLAERYENGAPLYEGTQVLNAHGEWVRHGVWNAWYEDGGPWERGAYADGVEEGPWDWWYENGNPMSSGSFRAGQRVGPWSWWHPDGRLMMTGDHDEDGLGQGRWTYWHANGIKAAEGRMVDGELDGRWLVWDVSGVLSSERGGVYEAGERVGD